MLGIWNSPTSLRFHHFMLKFLCREPRPKRLKGFLEEVSDFVASLVGIINGHMLRLLRPFADPLAGIAGGSVCQTERFLSAICSLNSNGFTCTVNRLDRALRCFEAALADAVYFFSRFFGSFGRIMHDHVTAFLQAPKRIIRTFADLFRAVDRSASYEMKRVLGAIGRLHDDGFRGGTDMLDGPLNRARHVLRGGSNEGNEYQTQDQA